MRCEPTELGYTPNNLRALLCAHGTTQREAAELLNVSLRTVQYWATPMHKRTRSDMPLHKWCELLKKLGEPLDTRK